MYINTKWTINLNITNKLLKLLEETLGYYLDELEAKQIFLNSNSQNINHKTEK